MVCTASDPPARSGLLLGQHALEVVEARAPAVLVVADGLFVPEVAVGEADEGDAVGLLEVVLDELAHGVRVVVPEPGEGEAAGRVDLRVLAASAVLLARVRVAHDDAHVAADAQVDHRDRRLPVASGVKPAAHDLLARPRVEDRVGGRVEGALHAQRGVGCAHPSGLRWSRRRCSHIQARARRSAVPAPAAEGRTSSTGSPAMWAITPPSRTRRAGATTGRAWSAGSPRASPPTPPGGRAR